TLNNTTVSGNSASGIDSASGIGGGIHNSYNGTITLNNSTVSGNSAAGSGGGIYNKPCFWFAWGSGQYYYYGGTVRLNNSTVSGNSAAGSGGGIFNNYAGTLTTRNTIIAGNTAPTGPDLSGYLGSLGHNLIGNTSGGSGGFDATDL